MMTETIHESFIISRTGKVRREVRVGTDRRDDFNDPANVTIQQLVLNDDGVSELSLTPARLSNLSAKGIVGVPVRISPNAAQAAWLKFDDGLKSSSCDVTTEQVRLTNCAVTGNKALWKKGVSGTSLAFDGYFSKVTLPRELAPSITDKLTFEAWVALGAYPWNDVGIVHCSVGKPIDPEDYKHGYRAPYTYRPWKMKGYMLGVDPYGRAIFKINGEQIGGSEITVDQKVKKSDVLPTYRWTHLSVTYGRQNVPLRRW